MPKPFVLSYIRNRAGAFVRGLLRCFGISGRTTAVYEKRGGPALKGIRSRLAS